MPIHSERLQACLKHQSPPDRILKTVAFIVSIRELPHRRTRAHLLQSSRMSLEAYWSSCLAFYVASRVTHQARILRR